MDSVNNRFYRTVMHTVAASELMVPKLLPSRSLDFEQTTHNTAHYNVSNALGRVSRIDNVTASNHSSSSSFVGAFSVIGSALNLLIYTSRAPSTPYHTFAGMFIFPPELHDIIRGDFDRILRSTPRQKPHRPPQPANHDLPLFHVHVLLPLAAEAPVPRGYVQLAGHRQLRWIPVPILTFAGILGGFAGVWLSERSCMARLEEIEGSVGWSGGST